MIPSYIDIEAIFDHYDAVFFDAYGVLVDGIDALPNAEKARKYNECVSNELFHCYKRCIKVH
ncbi:MAG: hypothetical protein Ct9H300mP19_09490 [Dehalococcoidia bacterium]|nr:MAG: hypothetical protein Ct9H300mP19_09490 [Dehalococcoidia bacterium]